jgi:hypothetical protein
VRNRPPRPPPPSLAIRAGDELYLVEELDLPDQVVHTWRVTAHRVDRTRADGFTFESQVGHARLHSWGAIDTTYYRSAEAALTAFVAARVQDVRRAESSIAEAQRAIAWVDGVDKTEVAVHRRRRRRRER